ncbi:MAG: flagellar biosynthesis protein FlgN [Sulfitobacter sp.]
MINETLEADRFDDLLEQERALLLAGDFEGLGVLIPAKEELVSQLLKDVDVGRDHIIKLEGKLRRNQLLLDGASDGIRSVAVRLAALRQVRTSLDTYDSYGRKQQVLTPKTPKVEKRA